MRQPEYWLRIRESGTGFAPGSTLAELDLAKNLGWSEYLNQVGEAFFTMTQGDRKMLDFYSRILEPLHLEIYRDGTQVFGGWLGETDENETDVIFHAYSYVSSLFWLHTDWDIEWSGAQINTIVSDCWTRATTLTDSMLAWSGSRPGTIEAPVTTSGGSTAIVLPKYSANHKRLLFVMQELAAMAASDTTNRVIFEMTPGGTFNFWKNRGSTLAGTRWQYGGAVVGYRRLRAPMDRRNVLLGVGSSPHDIVLRRTDENTSDRSTNGRREEALYYSWVRDATELERVNKLRLTRGLRDDNQLALSFMPGRVIPARAAGADYQLGDYVPVLIENGVTQINENKLVTGQQIVVTRGVEHVRAIVQDSL